MFSCKSTSQSRDILYEYDALARFQAAQGSTGAIDARLFVRYQALGLAILRSHAFEAVAHLIDDPDAHGGQRRSVLIVDEIDKAPRDFPNDLLHEFDRLQFSVPELIGTPPTPDYVDPNFRPVVIITSNSERVLPDAFLRRCVYYNIEFDEKALPTIVALRVGEAWTRKPLLLDLLEAFKHLRSPEAGLEKKPGTAEFLNWLQFFAKNGATPDSRLKQHRELLVSSLSIVIKHRRDLQNWRDRVDELTARR